MKTLATCLIVLLVDFCLAAAEEASRAKPQANRTAKPQAKSTAPSLGEAQRRLLEARTRYDRAQAAQPGFAHSVTIARQRALQDIANSEELRAATAERDSVWRDHEARRKQVLEMLNDRADYQAAVRDARTASDRLRALPDDTSLSDEQRRTRSSDCALQLRRPGEMEKEALKADADLWELQQQRALAEAQLATVRQTLQQSIDSTAGVQQALESQRRATEELTVARQELDARTGELQLAQSRAAADQQRRKTTPARDKPAKPKKNKPPA